MGIFDKLLPQAVGNRHAEPVEAAIQKVGGDATVKNGYVNHTTVAMNLTKPLTPEQTAKVNDGMTKAGAGYVSPDRMTVHVKRK